MEIINLAWKHSGTDRSAGSKAPMDAQAIVGRMENVKTIWLYTFSWTGLFTKWLGRLLRILEGVGTFCSIKRGSVVFLQFPGLLVSGPVWKMFVKPLIRYRRARTIVLVHDINSIRCGIGSIVNYEYDSLTYILKTASVIISHNQTMSDIISSMFSIPRNKIIELGMFDYLCDFAPRDAVSVNKKSVVIAGNLSGKKAGYLADLDKVKRCEWHLFGPNFNSDLDRGRNIVYHGSLPAEELPNQIGCFGFGLVWDGESIETCSGGYGEYLKVNNPHKLSLYLASGLPVIVWTESAMSKFVEDNHIGFSIDSILDIDKRLNEMTQRDYSEFRRNSANIGDSIRAGGFLTKALAHAIDIL